MRWRDGRGRWTRLPSPDQLRLTRLTWVVLSAAHLDHDPGNNAARNLAALCQRCHINHDRPYHLMRRRLTYRARLAIGDLFEGRYPSSGEKQS
jgi:glyoxylase-like metal-dependent hydrolase (beta-lactamase superfamily II)